ncbi:glycosyltransferase family 2 protein [Candidatus Saccharibacteria bacterium]|nr:glycosyltransferase family 2 protein [Candidatus Saccharibacteria bacterium]
MAFISVITILLVGVVAFFTSKKPKNLDSNDYLVGPYKPARRIAILIASKDGEKTIAQTVRAAAKNGRKVFVVSDGSTDKTASEAKKAGATVLALRKNIGKPSALHRAYKHFKLGKRFDAVAILDDDVLISRDFVILAKHLMGNDVAITVGKNITHWPDEKRWNIWLAARTYSYWCYQLTLRRLQSAANVMNCISGSNSLYRTEVLDQVLSGHTPYIVDDTYWTLETHRLGLGKIVYAPRAHAWIQDPTNFRDWYKQNLRWMWGTYQGIIGHQIGSQFNRFHMSYVFLMAEWILYIISGPICIWLILQGGPEHIPRQLLILASGYALWVVGAALSLKLPRLLFFIPAIAIADFIFRFLMVHAFFKALRQKTVLACVWDSPKRFDTRSVTA